MILSILQRNFIARKQPTTHLAWNEGLGMILFESNPREKIWYF